MFWSEEQVLQGRDGKHWHFVYWYPDSRWPAALRVQRLFFWDAGKTSTGVVVFLPGATVPYSRIRDLMKSLAAKKDMRQRHEQELKFPLARFYSEVGSLQEEASLLEGDRSV